MSSFYFSVRSGGSEAISPPRTEFSSISGLQADDEDGIAGSDSSVSALYSAFMPGNQAEQSSNLSHINSTALDQLSSLALHETLLKTLIPPSIPHFPPVIDKQMQGWFQGPNPRHATAERSISRTSERSHRSGSSSSSNHSQRLGAIETKMTRLETLLEKLVDSQCGITSPTGNLERDTNALIPRNLPTTQEVNHVRVSSAPLTPGESVIPQRLISSAQHFSPPRQETENRHSLTPCADQPHQQLEQVVQRDDVVFDGFRANEQNTDQAPTQAQQAPQPLYVHGQLNPHTHPSAYIQPTYVQQNHDQPQAQWPPHAQQASSVPFVAPVFQARQIPYAPAPQAQATPQQTNYAQQMPIVSHVHLEQGQLHHPNYGPTPTPPSAPVSSRTGSRKHVDPEELGTRRKLGAHFLLLLKNGVSIALHQIEDYAIAWKEAGPLRCAPCCTVESFGIDITGSAHSPWNKSAAKVYASSFMHTYKFDVNKENTKMIVRSFHARVRYRQVTYKFGLLPKEEQLKLESQHRRDVRCNSLFHKRYEIVENHPRLSHHLLALTQLGVAGMSSDESDNNDGLPLADNECIVAVNLLPWRDRTVTEFLSTIDSVGVSQGIDPGSTSKYRGALPRRRLRDPLNARISLRPAVKDLPQSAYDANWIRSLADPKYDVRPQVGEYAFTHHNELHVRTNTRTTGLVRRQGRFAQY